MEKQRKVNMKVDWSLRSGLVGLEHAWVSPETLARRDTTRLTPLNEVIYKLYPPKNKFKKKTNKQPKNTNCKVTLDARTMVKDMSHHTHVTEKNKIIRYFYRQLFNDRIKYSIRNIANIIIS